MENNYRSMSVKRSSESVRLAVSTILGVVFGFFVGISYPTVSNIRLSLVPNLSATVEMAFSEEKRLFDTNLPATPKTCMKRTRSSGTQRLGDSLKIFVESNPCGAELLPSGIVVAQTDLYPRRLWGDPKEDLTKQPTCLVTFTVGFDQAKNIDTAIKKFSEDFTIMLFHYDGRTSEWEQFEWSKRAIHVSVKQQTKWWYAKRFLHPDVVSAYDYIFIWDEDLGLEHFDAKKYIQLVTEHGLEISQPGLEASGGLMWEMTKKKDGSEVHKETLERPGWCNDLHSPPCAGFVEMMAPVFSRNAWRCVWHMIQNDLVHGWGLEFALRRCAEPAHEKIGVVDSQWVVHQVIPSLGNQGNRERFRTSWQGVRERSKFEWAQFQARLAHADSTYLDGKRE